MKKAHELVTAGRRNSRHSPRNGFTAYSALSPAIGFVATVPAQCKALSRVDASIAASGPHGFAVRGRRSSSTGSTVPDTLRNHRISRPTCRDDRDTPLLRARDAPRPSRDLPDGESKEFLRHWVDFRHPPKPQTDLPDGQVHAKAADFRCDGSGVAGSRSQASMRQVEPAQREERLQRSSVSESIIFRRRS
jgi:hypothetical protein